MKDPATRLCESKINPEFSGIGSAKGPGPASPLTLPPIVQVLLLVAKTRDKKYKVLWRGNTNNDRDQQMKHTVSVSRYNQHMPARLQSPTTTTVKI